MSYHILLASEENFEICIEKGVYGAVKKSSDKSTAAIISCTFGIKPGDFIFFYVKNIGIYGLWRVTTPPFYDEEKIWPDGEYPFRFCFEPVIRKFTKPVVLSDILDLRDNGKIWTFDLGSSKRKNQYTITTNEGKEVIRLLLRNNPIFIPAEQIKIPTNQRSKSLSLYH